MPRHPLIALDGNVFAFEGNTVHGVYASYLEALADAGAVPLIVPPLLEEEALRETVGRLDGVCLTGGQDLPPEWYGQERHPRTVLAHPQRLKGSRRLVEQAIRAGLPILGICMGCQLLNVVLGGDLIQDIPDLVGTQVSHSPFETFHRVRLEPGSRLSLILGSEELEVNSSHHQAVGRAGTGLRPVAWAPDGVIEALEGEASRFLLAVQWHPERMLERPEQRALFRAFVEAARSR